MRWKDAIALDVDNNCCVFSLFQVNVDTEEVLSAPNILSTPMIWNSWTINPSNQEKNLFINISQKFLVSIFAIFFGKLDKLN